MIWLALVLVYVATVVFGVSLGRAAALGDRRMKVVDVDPAFARVTPHPVAQTQGARNA